MRPTQRLARSGGVTHEGGRAALLNDEATLRRSVMACLLWEDTFYEDGESVYDRIKRLCASVAPDKIAEMAVTARQKMYLRHVPLVLCRELLRRGALRPETLAAVLLRADGPAEFLALLWAEGRRYVPRAVRRGIEAALPRFDEYQLAKWGQRKPITMRDVFRMVRPNPKLEPIPGLWRKVVKNELAVPDTWEVALSSAGKDADKHAIWLRLLEERKLGGLALLRNLRNMAEAKVPKEAVVAAMAEAKFGRVLPFRFLAAAKHVPQWEGIIDAAMLRQTPARMLPGTTYLLVDVSGSMDQGRVSQKSELTALDVACGVAILAREMCDNVRVFTFSNALVEVPSRRGMALRDAVTGSQQHGGTQLAGALAAMPKDCVRLIVITDEQAHDDLGGGFGRRRYMVNVATYEKGVGYGDWTRINGWSEAVLDYIAEVEGIAETALDSEPEED